MRIMERPSVSQSQARPNSAARRDQITDAALRVMIAEGVYNVTTRKIAEAAQVNVATLHYHFHNKEEIIFSAMERLSARYRRTLAENFVEPQKLSRQIEALLWFILGEVQNARSEQLALQEFTLYVCRIPGAQHLASEKEREIRSLYSEILLMSSDVGKNQGTEIDELTDFIYACFVGILNQWLATGNKGSSDRATARLIAASRALAAELLD